MIRWLRIVYFSRPLCGPIAVLFLSVLPAYWLFRWFIGFTAGVLDSPEYVNELAKFGLGASYICVGGVSVLYGIGRAVAFHPCFDTEYRAWLERTPFTETQPLPIGPPQLVWQDALVLTAITALGSGYEIGPYRVVAWVLTPYLFFHAGVLYELASKVVAYVVYLGLPFLWYSGGHVVLRWSVALFLYLVVRSQMSRVLRCMVERSAQETQIPPSTAAEVVRQTSEVVGAEFNVRRIERSQAELANLFWPYNRLAPVSVAKIPILDAVCLPIVVTWWIASGMSLIPQSEFLSPQDSFAPWITSFVVSQIFSLGRIVRYSSGYTTPISIWGRLMTFRWIVPRFDRVFVAPILAVVAALGATTVAAVFKAPPAFLYTVPCGIALLLLVNLGPSLRNWKLTGGHRLVPGMAAKTAVGGQI